VNTGSTVLVTGGGGFIGGHLVARLVRDRRRVRCLLRPLPGRSGPAGAETVWGDVTDPKTLPRAVAGVETIFHLAGKTKARSLEEFRATNRDGTVNLLNAVREEGAPLRRFVLVSSLAAAGPSGEDRPREEEDPPAPVSFYGRSKLEAEEALIGAERGFGAAILRPAVVYGPGERDVFQVLRWIARGFRPQPTGADRLFSAVYVDDLVEALVAAAGVGDDGTWFVSDGNVYSWRRSLREISRIMGRGAVPLPLPLGAMALAAAGGRKLPGLDGSFFLDKLRELAHPYWTCSIARARKDLGFHPRFDLGTGMEETVAWYRNQGWLKPVRTLG